MATPSFAKATGDQQAWTIPPVPTNVRVELRSNNGVAAGLILQAQPIIYEKKS
jgi:hypothetical protein